VAYLKLLRPKDWAKNLFLFIPVFFAGEFLNVSKLTSIIYGFIAFSFIASSIYIINDYKDVEDDRKHPVKRLRPIASGAVTPAAALFVCALLIIAGFGVAWWIGIKFMFVLGIYFCINLGYSLGLKAIPILDIIILAAGFGWLAFGIKLGVEKAWLVGVAPFIAASLIKNALGATLVPALRRMFDRR